MPAAAVMISPWVDLSERPDERNDHSGRAPRPARQSSIIANQPFDFLPRDLVIMFAELTVGKGDPRDPSFSPFFADLHGLPPIFVLGGECEVLADQIKAFAGRVIKENSASCLRLYEDMVHVFPMFFFPE